MYGIQHSVAMAFHNMFARLTEQRATEMCVLAYSIAKDSQS